MANPEHLKILKEGVEVWNKWREKNPKIIPKISDHYKDLSIFALGNFTGINLSKISLNRFNFWRGSLLKANLSEVDFSESDFSDVNLSYSNLKGADLSSCNISKSNLTKSNLCGADLSGANLTGAILDGTNFDKCELFETVFGLNDLSTCKGLDTVEVFGPCIIDFHTLQVSRNLPRSFLTKIGLPELFIDYLPEFRDSNPIRMYPVFLSHSSKNKDFARKLYEALIARGVTVFFDEKNMKPGDEITERLTRSIDLYDKMLLVCSKESLESPWVDRELNRILRKEDTHFEEQKRKVNLLIPITIDDHIFQWGGAKADDVRRYVVGDFRGWQDDVKFEKALDELIHALNVDRGEDAPKSFL